MIGRARTPGRRAFLRASGAVVAAAALGDATGRVLAGQPAPGATSARLLDGLYLIEGVGANAVLGVDGAEGALLVDSGAPGFTGALLEQVQQRAGPAPPRVLFSTHWRLPHTGGNDTLGAAGTRIIAHENTRQWMSSRFYVRWEDRLYEERVPEALPVETFRSHEPQPLKLTLGGLQVEYAQLENARTDGDIYVFFPDRNVLVAGGAVSTTYPIPDFATGGWIDGLIDGTERLLELADADTLIIPERGAVVDREHLKAQHEMASTIRERIAEGMRAGRGYDEIFDAGATREFDGRWSAADATGWQFLYNGYQDLAWRGPGGVL